MATTHVGYNCWLLPPPQIDLKAWCRGQSVKLLHASLGQKWLDTGQKHTNEQELLQSYLRESTFGHG